MYFFERNVDEPENLELSVVQIEIGYKMELYLSPIKAGNILDETIMANDDLQIGTAHLLYELLTVVYVDIFGYDSFNYDLNQYEVYLDNFDEYSEYDDIWGWIIYALLSPYSAWWEKSILVFVGIMILGAGGGLVKNIGGGGKSGGMGIRRKK